MCLLLLDIAVCVCMLLLSACCVPMQALNPALACFISLMVYAIPQTHIHAWLLWHIFLRCVYIARSPAVAGDSLCMLLLLLQYAPCRHLV